MEWNDEDDLEFDDLAFDDMDTEKIEEYTPMELMVMFKEAIGKERKMSPEDLKKAVSEWIDDNVYNWI